MYRSIFVMFLSLFIRIQQVFESVFDSLLAHACMFVSVFNQVQQMFRQ